MTIKRRIIEGGNLEITLTQEEMYNAFRDHRLWEDTEFVRDFLMFNIVPENGFAKEYDLSEDEIRHAAELARDHLEYDSDAFLELWGDIVSEAVDEVIRQRDEWHPEI